MDPNASRETLDHSIMYIFAVALEDGKWHHINSYTSERSNKKSTIELWKKIKTFEDKKWTKKYHDPNPKKKCFGGRVIIKMKDGSKIEDQLGIADAHPNGKKPFKRENYINKFKTLTANIIDKNLYNAEAKIEDQDVKIAFLVFISFIISIFILSSILTLDNLTFENSFKLSILTLTNTVSSALYGMDSLSFFDLNNFTKMSLILFMILGKIEIIAVIYLIKRFIFRE